MESDFLEKVAPKCMYTKIETFFKQKISVYVILDDPKLTLMSLGMAASVVSAELMNIFSLNSVSAASNNHCSLSTDLAVISCFHSNEPFEWTEDVWKDHPRDAVQAPDGCPTS